MLLLEDYSSDGSKFVMFWAFFCVENSKSFQQLWKFLNLYAITKHVVSEEITTKQNVTFFANSRNRRSLASKLRLLVENLNYFAGTLLGRVRVGGASWLWVMAFLNIICKQTLILCLFCAQNRFLISDSILSQCSLCALLVNFFTWCFECRIDLRNAITIVMLRMNSLSWCSHSAHSPTSTLSVYSLASSFQHHIDDSTEGKRMKKRSDPFLLYHRHTCDC